MNRLVKYTILFLLLSSYGMSKQNNNDTDDPFALFKLAPVQKATLHYVKKGGKEFVYLKGKGLKDYTVDKNDDGISLNILGHKIRGGASLSDKSAYVDGVDTQISDEGSRVNLKLKGKPGFKIYKRPSGLILAMGPGYEEIAEDDLEGLDEDVSSPSNIDVELDSLLSNGKKTPAATTAKTSKTDELDALADEAKSEPVAAKEAGKDKIDQDLDKILAEFDSDSELDEQVAVQEGLEKSVTLQNIRIAKIEDKIILVFKTDRPAKYEQKDTGNAKEIVLELPNTKLLKKLERVETKASKGLVASVRPEQLEGPYKAVKVTIKLNKDVQPEIYQRNNLIYLELPTVQCVALTSTPTTKTQARVSGAPAPRSLRSYDDMEAARQMSNVNFEDYLANPTEFYGKRMSIQVSNANVLDVLRMIQEVSGINIVVSEKVKGNVDVSLRNVPWDQALSVVLQNAQLGYVRQGSVVRVAPLADLRDERRLAAEALDAHKNLEPLKVMVAKLNYINSKEAEDKISVLLSKRGKVSIDKDAKTLVVYDIEDVINKADKLLRAIDIKPYSGCDTATN